jgi:hypothetical protein
MQDVVTKERLAKYFDYTKRGLEQAGKAIDKAREKEAKDFLDMSEMQSISDHDQEPHADGKGKRRCPCRQCLARVVLDMASRYFSDAGHFEEKGDVVTAFAALNYAHGWLDAGARLGLFKVNDSTLFTVDD